jgi:hypothetical protein
MEGHHGEAWRTWWLGGEASWCWLDLRFVFSVALDLDVGFVLYCRRGGCVYIAGESGGWCRGINRWHLSKWGIYTGIEIRAVGEWGRQGSAQY